MKSSISCKTPVIFFSLVLVNSLLSAQQPAVVIRDESNITIVWAGKNILQGRLDHRQTPCRIQNQHQTIQGALYQIITITADDSKAFELTATINGSTESIACESEPRDGALKVVRHSVGVSNNLLNQAVYDRQEDWLLSFDANDSKIKITPAENNAFQVHAEGSEIVIRFRPQYYKQHRGLSYFNPKEYTVWERPVVGWCSWYAYLNKVKEEDVRHVADVLSEKLKPYGLEYIQIDDGYQQVPIGMPQTWLHPNAKFPAGLTSLAEYIKSKGFVPGIWTNVSFADSAAARQNKLLFVQDDHKSIAKGNWIGYVMDGSNPAAIQKLISPVYSGLKSFGWQYFKLDALRHLKYEGYNSYADYFLKKGYDRNEAFRNVVKEVRDQIGKETFLLACWGIRPELVGIANACRIGNDGFSYAGLAQFNSYNNIIWRNDPDHIELSRKEAYRSCTATSLTGSLFMLTDKPEVYQSSGLLDAARRTIPVLYTQPGQVYDVDPSVSSKISLSDVELSGSGPRPFDASTTTTTGLFALEINKLFENWLVLARLDERDKTIPFGDLGLDPTKEFLVFEFWTKKFLGTFQKQLTAPPIDSTYHCQIFCFRENQRHPQLMATNRHVSCGGLELSDVQWRDNALHGVSELVAGDDYTLYIYEPDDFAFARCDIVGASLASNVKEGKVRKLTIKATRKERAVWTIKYK